MKKITNLPTKGLMLAALVAAVGLAPAARAQFTLSYEEAFGGHHVGDLYAGPIRINLQDFDMGTLYPDLGAPGTARGYGQNGTGTQTIQGGINTLDGTQTVGATGAQVVPTTVNGVAQPASNGTEDSWGIARIISITDLSGGVVWSEAGKNAQLTIMFYGEKDFYVNQLANGFQEIDGTGLHVNLYYQSKSDGAYTAYDPFPGSAGRTGVSSYTTATDGTLVLSAVSTPGFIHDAGTLGGLATEFASVYNQTSGGTGQTYLSVTGGANAFAFDQNYFDSPYVAGVTADLFAQFTTVPNTTTGDWLVRSNDPVTGAFVPVPEPSTYAIMGVAFLSGLVALRRRALRLFPA